MKFPLRARYFVLSVRNFNHGTPVEREPFMLSV
jgi:hypothetical protein